MTNATGRERVRQLWGRSFEELAHQWSRLGLYLLEMADEARGMMN